jgi:tetratricopeptide (TPR) repeat protein
MPDEFLDDTPQPVIVPAAPEAPEAPEWLDVPEPAEPADVVEPPELGEVPSMAMIAGVPPLPPVPPIPAIAPMAMARIGSLAFAFQTPPAAPKIARSDEEERYYERGQRDLERNRWDQAANNFSEAVARGGARADGALYWKAYALNKLGRRDEALAATAELRKSHPSSRWLDDARALEIEI